MLPQGIVRQFISENVLVGLEIKTVGSSDGLQASDMGLIPPPSSTRNTNGNHVKIKVFTIRVVSHEVFEGFLIGSVFDSPLGGREAAMEVEDALHELKWCAAFSPCFENNCFASWTDANNHNSITVTRRGFGSGKVNGAVNVKLTEIVTSEFLAVCVKKNNVLNAVGGLAELEESEVIDIEVLDLDVSRVVHVEAGEHVLPNFPANFGESFPAEPLRENRSIVLNSSAQKQDHIRADISEQHGVSVAKPPPSKHDSEGASLWIHHKRAILLRAGSSIGHHLVRFACFLGDDVIE